MPGAAEVAELVALIQHLAHPRRDALQVTVEVGPAVDILRDHGIAVTTAPSGKHHLLLRSRRQHWRAELAGEVDSGMLPAVVEQARHASVRKRHDELRGRYVVELQNGQR